jgi:hypothetical protein
MAITKTQMQAARKRAHELKSHVPRVVSARHNSARHSLEIEFESGTMLNVPLSALQGLHAARPSELRIMEVSPSGYGIHVPAVDADIYVPALLEGVFGTKAWMSERSRKGGQATTPAKKAAARANGSLGGRPRKQVVEEEMEEAA